MSQESGEKKEKPTPKRLQDAKKKGQIPRSKELVGALSTSAILGILYMGSSSFYSSIEAMFDISFKSIDKPFLTVLSDVAFAAIKTGLSITFPFLAVVVALTIVGSLAQGGFVFASEVIKPKVENMSPKKAIKNIFSIKNLVEFLKSLVKACALIAIIFSLIKGHLRDLFYIPDCGLSCLVSIWGYIGIRIFAYSVLVYFVVAIFDTFFQQQQHIKSLRMSMEEIKKEFKETEGDPHIKGARRGMFQEIISEGINSKLAQTSTLVTNPTHVAIGLRYVEGETKLPIITMKEHGDVVLKIRKIARDQEIPIMENRKLARALLAQGKEGDPIPRELIPEVAEVIKWMLDLKKKDQKSDS